MSDEIYIGRQPIYDTKLDVVSYELLFRDGSDNRASFADGDRATSQVLINSLIEFGMENLVGDRQAFINCSRSFLTGEIPLPFEKEHLVLEILEDIEVDDELVASIRRLSSEGFRIALDDFVYESKFEPLLDLVDIVKLDCLAVDFARIAEQVKILKDYPVILLAEKVETVEEFESYKELGFDLFQGYFLSRPRIVRGSRLPNNKIALLQLLAKLLDPSVGIDELEELICHNVSLSYKLMRYTNSSSFGIRHKVESIQQSLVLLGLESVRTIVTLLVMSSVEDKPISLMANAMLRAKMCELLAQRLGRKDRQSFFTIGLFSILDAVMDTSMEDILKELPFSDEIKAALTGFEGVLGEGLRCTLAYERGNWNEAKCLDVPQPKIRDAYLEAVRWIETDERIGGLLNACRQPVAPSTSTQESCQPQAAV